MIIPEIIPHFIRPWAWLLLPAVLLLFFYWYKRLINRPHIFLKASRKTVLPLDNTLVSLKVGHSGSLKFFLVPTIFMGALTLAITGPSWHKHIENKEQAPTMILVNVSGNNKDNLELTRTLFYQVSGRPFGVILYAGSAHLLSPFTSDMTELNHMLDAASSENIMPIMGNKPEMAMKKAGEIFRQSKIKYGNIILIANKLEDIYVKPITQIVRDNNLSLHIMDTSGLSYSKNLKSLARKSRGEYTLSRDHSVLEPLLSTTAYEEKNQKFNDDSIYILIFSLLCLLLICRKTRTERLLMILLCICSFHTRPAFSTEKNQHNQTESYYNRGNALAREHRFNEALLAYENAIKLTPGHEDAIHNRQIIIYLLNSVHTGDLSGLPDNSPDKNEPLIVQPLGSSKDTLALFLKKRFKKESIAEQKRTRRDKPQ